MPEAAHAAGRMNAPDRRRQLLDAALELFSRKGFGGTTTKEIAAAAGVTEAIIFRHFPSKQALYTAVLDSKAEACGHEEWLAEIQKHMDRNDDAGVLRTLGLAQRLEEVNRQYNNFVRVLKKTLDVEPGPDLRRVYEAAQQGKALDLEHEPF